jgi:hypothetical protein
MSWRTLLLAVCLVVCVAAPAPAGSTKRLLLVASGPDGHSPTTHDRVAGLHVLARCLEPVPDLEVTTVRADSAWKDGPAPIDRCGHALDRVIPPQLQDPHVVATAGAWAVLTLQDLPECGEGHRPLPAAQHRRLVERRRPTRQRRQGVQRVQHLLVAAGAARGGRDHVARRHHLDVVDVPLIVTAQKAWARGTRERLPSKWTVWSLSTWAVGKVQASKGRAGNGKALAWSRGKRTPIGSCWPATVCSA